MTLFQMTSIWRPNYLWVTKNQNKKLNIRIVLDSMQPGSVGMRMPHALCSMRALVMMFVIFLLWYPSNNFPGEVCVVNLHLFCLYSYLRNQCIVLYKNIKISKRPLLVFLLWFLISEASKFSLFVLDVLSLVDGRRQ